MTAHPYKGAWRAGPELALYGDTVTERSSRHLLRPANRRATTRASTAGPARVRGLVAPQDQLSPVAAVQPYRNDLTGNAEYTPSAGARVGEPGRGTIGGVGVASLIVSVVGVLLALEALRRAMGARKAAERALQTDHASGW